MVGLSVWVCVLCSVGIAVSHGIAILQAIVINVHMDPKSPLDRPPSMTPLVKHACQSFTAPCGWRLPGRTLLALSSASSRKALRDALATRLVKQTTILR